MDYNYWHAICFYCGDFTYIHDSGQRMMKKTLLALSLIGLAGSATASPFHVDTHFYNDGDPADKVCDNCTAVKHGFTYLYDSATTVTDTNGDGVGVGDYVETKGGYGVVEGGLSGAYGRNAITNWKPIPSGGAGDPVVDSNNGYGSGWQMTFSFSGLKGLITEYEEDLVTGQTTKLELEYGAFGTMDLFYKAAGTGGFVNVMDVKVVGAATGSGGTGLLGEIDFLTADAFADGLGGNDWMLDLFHSEGTTCNGKTSFFDIWNECDGVGNPLINLGFFADFNTNPKSIVKTDLGSNGLFDQYRLTGDHDGSANFNVPEPSTLALFGGALMLLGVSARRRKA